MCCDLYHGLFEKFTLTVFCSTLKKGVKEICENCLGGNMLNPIFALPKINRRVGQGVKTPPFHGGITGSNPVRGTSPALAGFFVSPPARSLAIFTATTVNSTAIILAISSFYDVKLPNVSDRFDCKRGVFLTISKKYFSFFFFLCREITIDFQYFLVVNFTVFDYCENYFVVLLLRMLKTRCNFVPDKKIPLDELIVYRKTNSKIL